MCDPRQCPHRREGQVAEGDRGSVQRHSGRNRDRAGPDGGPEARACDQVRARRPPERACLKRSYSAGSFRLTPCRSLPPAIHRSFRERGARTMADRDQRPGPSFEAISEGMMTRRGFVMATLATGFAMAVRPVSAETITTDQGGLVAGEIQIATTDGRLPA